MITVIIPTMWKCDVIEKILPNINNHPLVDEIILIDNAPDKKIEKVCNLSKVNYVTFGKNIYVVDSWNYGWKNAKHEKLLIINDDCNFNLKMIDLVYDKISPEIGIIIPDTSVISEDIKTEINPIRFHPKIIKTDSLKHKSGIFIAIHKETYEEIPSDFKIYFNDVWLFQVAVTRGKQNFMIVHDKAAFNNPNNTYYFATKMSTTVKHFPEITRKEWKIWKDVFDKHGIIND